MKTEKATVAKFVQIAAVRDGLYALDENGVIWEYAAEDKGWMDLYMARLEMEEEDDDE